MSASINLTPELAEYLRRGNINEHPILEKCRRETAEAYPELAWLQISPEQASFMQFLVWIQGARRILEIGTFTGYSALAFALALEAVCPDDWFVLTIDHSEEYLSRAQRHWQAAGVDQRILALCGSGRETLRNMTKALNQEPFDLVFIDADKQHVQQYYEDAVLLVRTRGLIIVDNILWGGKVADQSQTDPATEALRSLVPHVKADRRVHHNVCAIGDGLLLAQKL